MPIVSGELHNRYSGGGANSDPNASLGGVKSSVQPTDATLENLFANVDGAESAAGSTKYRCVYFHNANGSLTLSNPKVWIQTETPSPDTVIDIGLDPAGVGNGSTTGVATTVGDEDTAPAGVTFSHPTTEGTALTIADLIAGNSAAIWVRRTVSPGAAAAASDNVVLRFLGDTPA